MRLKVQPQLLWLSGTLGTDDTLLAVFAVRVRSDPSPAPQTVRTLICRLRQGRNPHIHACPLA